MANAVFALLCTLCGLQAIVSRPWGRWNTDPVGIDHTTKNSLLPSKAPHARIICKPKPCWTAAARRPGRVSPARLSPRGGVSVHVWLRYGLRGGSSITDHDAFDRKSGRNEDCERRQGRLQRQAMPLEGACPGDYTKHVRNTSRPIVHVAVLPDRRENRTG